MFRHALLAVLIAACPSVPVFAGDTKPAAAAAEVTSKTPKMVCRRQIMTGSVMPKTVCRTTVESDSITAKAQDDFDKTRNLDRSGTLDKDTRGN